VVGGRSRATQTSKYVKLIQTDASGKITVTATGLNDSNIDDKLVELTPYP
jgi:hypothetical protein